MSEDTFQNLIKSDVTISIFFQTKLIEGFMKFGIDVDCTKDKMTEIYNQFVEVMMLAKTSIGDCFLEDQKNCYLENQKYCMLQPEDSNENLAALLYDLHLDYPTETYFQE